MRRTSRLAIMSDEIYETMISPHPIYIEQRLAVFDLSANLSS